MIDGLDGLQRATFHSERVHHIFTALANELRARNVTTLYTYEVPKFIGPDLEAPISGVSALVENLIYLRFIERHSRIFRVFSILKVRDAVYDSTLHAFTIDPGGIKIDPTFSEASTTVVNAPSRSRRRRPRA